MAQSNSINLAHAQKPVPCDTCEGEEVPGTYYCFDCKKTLCEECERHHKKFTTGHNVVLRSDIVDSDIYTLCCADHDKEASFYCEECGRPACGKCVTGKHQGHKMIDLNDIIERKKEDIVSRINDIQNNVLPKLLRQKEECQENRRSYVKKAEEIFKKMETENQTLHRTLDQMHTGRRESFLTDKELTLTKFDECMTKTSSDIKVCEKVVAEYQDALRKNSAQSIVNLAEQKNNLLETVALLQMEENPLFGSDIMEHLVSFPSILNAFQTVKATVISNIKCPKLLGSLSICITKNDEVWLSGDNRELVMVNINGQVLRTRSMQHRSNALAAMDNGDIIISPHPSDSHVLRRLRSDGKEENLFDASPAWCTGVSFTAEQKILVCTEDGRMIRTDVDGKKSEQVYKGSGGDSTLQAVENGYGNIYISDRKLSNIVLADKEGNILLLIKATTSGKKISRPVGLAVDKFGNILCADKVNDCVYIIDQRNLVRELVGNSHGITQPRWLAVDNSNNLWITQYDGTVHVVKYSFY